MTDEQAKLVLPGTPVWYADYVIGVGPVLKTHVFQHPVADRDPSPHGIYCVMSNGSWAGAGLLHTTLEEARQGIVLAIRGRIAVLENHLREYEDGHDG